jgi:hypothetical protein
MERCPAQDILAVPTGRRFGTLFRRLSKQPFPTEVGPGERDFIHLSAPKVLADKCSLSSRSMRSLWWDAADDCTAISLTSFAVVHRNRNHR